MHVFADQSFDKNRIFESFILTDLVFTYALYKKCVFFLC
jgi:hypothetical protein